MVCKILQTFCGDFIKLKLNFNETFRTFSMASDWSLRQPDGGLFEKCSIYQLDSIHSTNNWRDIPCASYETSQYICMVPAKKGNNTVVYKLKKIYIRFILLNY